MHTNQDTCCYVFFQMKPLIISIYQHISNKGCIEKPVLATCKNIPEASEIGWFEPVSTG